MKLKKRVLMLIVLLFLSVMPVNADHEGFIVLYNTSNTAAPDLVYFWHTQDGVSEMNNMVLTREFQDYLQKKGINKDGYELKLISPYSDEPNKIMVHNTTYKWYYSVKNSTTHNCSVRSPANRFTVVNYSSKTLGAIWIAYYRLISVAGVSLPVPVDRVQKEYYNVRNNMQLDFDPSAEMTHASINVYETWPYPWPSAGKELVPLGNWHTAYIKTGTGIYIYLS